MPSDRCSRQPAQPPVPADWIDYCDLPLESSRLPMRAESAGVARRRVRETLQLFDADPTMIDDAVLLTSEVVTNGLVHARPHGSALELSSPGTATGCSSRCSIRAGRRRTWSARRTRYASRDVGCASWASSRPTTESG